MDAAALRTFLTHHRMLSPEEIELLHEAQGDAATIDLAVERGLLQAQLVEDARALLADEMPRGLEPLLPGLVLLQEIGRGSSGRVFRAWQIKLRRVVAVKVLPRESLRNEAAKTRFIREARIAARLSHPSLVRAWDIGSAGESVFIILEYVEGESLQARLYRNGPIPISETLQIAIGIADGLAYAAANGIAHRDIKPANIQLTRSGVKILDLGLARPEGESELTLPMVALGTPGYISPEQARGEPNLTPKSDVYALGILIFRCISGRHPFKAIDGTDMLRAHIERIPPALTSLVKEVPDALSELVEAMLAKSVDGRPDAAKVAGHLRLLLSQIDGGKAQANASQRAPRSSALAAENIAPTKREMPLRLRYAAVALLAVVLTALPFWIFGGADDVDSGAAEQQRIEELKLELKAAKERAESERIWREAHARLVELRPPAPSEGSDMPPELAVREALAENERRFSEGR